MKKILTLALVLVLALPLVACGGQKQEDNSGLVVATSGDAIALDPIATNDNQSSNVMLQVYEGLVKLDTKTNEIVNCLADKIEQKDDTTYVVTIKQGVKFHNGETLTANDVVFSLKRAITAPNVQHLFNTIDQDSVKALDDHTVEFHLLKPYAGILASLAHPGGFICNEKAVTEGGDSYKMNPVGTGPFKLIRWSKADSVVFERFEDYHGTKPAYKNLAFRVIPEANNRTIELESGGVDLAYDLAPIDVKRIEEGEKTTLARGLDYGTTYLGFNCEKAPLNDVKVREAITLALDLDPIIEKVWLGVGRTATGPIPPTMKYSTSADYTVAETNIEKAKELLKEAGVAEGTELSIATNERQQRIDMATLMKGQLEKIGLKIRIDVLEWSAFNDLIKQGNQDMFMIAWTADSPDIDTYIYPCFHSTTVGEGGNYAFYKNEKLDQLMDDARVEVDDAKRGQLYKEAQELIHNEHPWIPLCHVELLVGMQKNIQGFQLSPFGWYELAPVTKASNK